MTCGNPQCGFEGLQANARFCARCGNAQRRGTPPPMPTGAGARTPKRSARGVWVLGGLVMFVFPAFAVLLLVTLIPHQNVVHPQGTTVHITPYAETVAEHDHSQHYPDDHAAGHRQPQPAPDRSR